MQVEKFDFKGVYCCCWLLGYDGSIVDMVCDYFDVIFKGWEVLDVYKLGDVQWKLVECCVVVFDVYGQMCEKLQFL